VLECLQKSLRIANSATEEIITVQLYCDTLDRYLYYLDRDAPAVRFWYPLKEFYVYLLWLASNHLSGHTQVREQFSGTNHVKR
jgi:hypothetical protein